MEDKRNNKGNYNTGYCNTGNYNTGNCNTGNCNTGSKNTGYWNKGNYNTGDYNTGDYNTGYCNTKTPKVAMFNKESNIDYNTEMYNKIYKTFFKYSKPLCEWISASNMTDEEKENNPKWEITQGYLKINNNTYNGNQVTKEDEEFIRGLPNFDEKILLECTGIDLSKKKVKISIDGKEILISKEEFESIKKQFLN